MCSCFSMMALVSIPGVDSFWFSVPVLTVLPWPFPEFLITELALASHSIPSFTLSSPSLLSPVLESHPPSAIIVDGSILPHTLELIYEMNEHEHHYVVVVGETDEKTLSKASEHIKIVRWSEVEAQGKAAATPITSPAPGDCHQFCGFSLARSSFIQVRTTYLPSLSIGTLTTKCELPASLTKILRLVSLLSAASFPSLRPFLLWTLSTLRTR